MNGATTLMGPSWWSSGVARKCVAMGEEERRDIDETVQRLCRAGDYRSAATQVIVKYGEELHRFARNRCRTDADADDVFAIFCEDLWRGVPNFAWRCGLRCWLYKLARHAGHRFATAPERRVEHNVELSDVTNQLAVCRTHDSAELHEAGVRNQLQDLRQRLNSEEQVIVMLRVDAELSFREIAQALALPALGLSDAELAREASRIRKRFQLAKRRLQRWAVETRLLAQ